MLSNKYFWVVAFILGSVLTYFLSPKKIEIKEKEVEKVVYKDVVSHQIKYIKPDGTVKIITDTKTIWKESEKTKQKDIVKQPTKRFLVYGGANVLDQTKIVLGTSYNILGPIDVGAMYRSGLYITVGVRF